MGLVAAVLIGLTGAPLHAQETEAAVLDPVRRLFDGMRAADTTAIRATLHPSATLVTTGVQDGVVVIRNVPIDDFIRAIGRSESVIDERIWDTEVRMDGNLASVWTKYDVVVGGEWSHCGVDAFQLVRSDGRWQILHIADTRRREDCWKAPDGR